MAHFYMLVMTSKPSWSRALKIIRDTLLNFTDAMKDDKKRDELIAEIDTLLDDRPDLLPPPARLQGQHGRVFNDTLRYYAGFGRDATIPFIQFMRDNDKN